MKKNLITAALMTLVTAILLGLGYPLLVTGLARVWPGQANGQLVSKNGVVVGSRMIAQPFTGAAYFHPRPSSAGAHGYDPNNSGGSNYGPTNQKLMDRVQRDVATLQAENPGKPVPVDLVTASGSGLDPHISPAAADFQLPRVARARGISESEVTALVAEHTQGRQFGLLGEPRVNVLELNLALDEKHPVTLTYDYQWADGFLMRTARRRDFSSAPFFLTDKSGILSQHQSAATLGAVWRWGNKEGIW